MDGWKLEWDAPRAEIPNEHTWNKVRILLWLVLCLYGQKIWEVAGRESVQASFLCKKNIVWVTDNRDTILLWRKICARIPIKLFAILVARRKRLGHRKHEFSYFSTKRFIIWEPQNSLIDVSRNDSKGFGMFGWVVDWHRYMIPKVAKSLVVQRSS